MKRIIAPACALLLVLAGCKSDKSATPAAPSQANPSPSTPSSPGTPSTPPPSTPTSPGTGTSATDIPGLTPLDYLALEQPIAGDHALRIVSPTVLELTRLSTKQPDPAKMDVWNFVDG